MACTETVIHNNWHKINPKLRAQAYSQKLCSRYSQSGLGFQT
ncbi:unnamed protein product [Moneuplotes crassus]|uniref:Uncharacterized protein n=1 Tax=Euplotes crassus TaxID=5936 RepID=A0AAD2DAX4_EUPCR|nr:unnamed protein product [Moneuplotes crassus]